MKTPEALKVVGPKAFGYADLDFVPLEAPNVAGIGKEAP